MMAALRQEYMAMVRSAAAQHEISPHLLTALILVESNGNPNAVSGAGAVGLCQFMPATARDMGLRVDDSVDDRKNPSLAIGAGAKYLAWLRDRLIISTYAVDATHKLALILAAYNAGIGRVQVYKGIPPFIETLLYIARVFRRMKELEVDDLPGAGDCPQC